MSNRRVYKYRFSVTQAINIIAPAGGRVVHVGADPEGFPAIWMEVDLDRPNETRRFSLAGTGHPIRPGLQHVASFVDAPFVWHIYE